VFSVIALRRNLVFFFNKFFREISKLFMLNIFPVLRFNRDDQAGVKMIGNKNLASDIHYLLIISPKSRLRFIVR